MNMETDDYTRQLMHDIVEKTQRCWNCNFCMSVCPVFKNTGGFYSHGGSGLTQSLYYTVLWDLLDEGEPKDIQELMHNLYRCTTCNACVNKCEDSSAGIPLLEIIDRGRKLLIEKAIGPLPAQKKILESIYKRGNPYGRSQKHRLEWAKETPGINLKKFPEQEADTLLFVGCATSFDPALHKNIVSLIKILDSCGIDYCILANEQCSADLALRLGDEALFEEKSTQNSRDIQETGAKTLITMSPHDFHAFSTDYKELADTCQVLHYTEFLDQKIKACPPRLKKTQNKITYHDPCYLSKHHHVTDAPRNLLQMTTEVPLLEMTANRRDSTCCGGGGGRIFAEIKEEERLSEMRVREALATGASVLATACPWCHIMFAEAVKDLGLEEKIQVKELAEIMCEALY